MAIRIEKRCPICRIRLSGTSAKCPKCGIKLHVATDCEGCEKLSGHNFCIAFNDTNNPIMREDGTCQGKVIQ